MCVIMCILLTRAVGAVKGKERRRQASRSRRAAGGERREDVDEQSPEHPSH